MTPQPTGATPRKAHLRTAEAAIAALVEELAAFKRLFTAGQFAGVATSAPNQERARPCMTPTI